MLKKTSNFAFGFVVGLGTGLILREVWPYLEETMRPMLKGATKAGMHAWDAGQEKYWQVRESIEDILAENRNELNQARMARGGEVQGEQKETVLH